MTKTTWIVKGPFGTRRIWKDDGGYFFVVNNIRYKNYDADLEVINESIPISGGTADKVNESIHSLVKSEI